MNHSISATLTQAPQFLAQLSTEMRTLLQDILPPAELLRQQADAVDPKIEQIIGGARRMLKLAESLVSGETVRVEEKERVTDTQQSLVLYIEDNPANFMLIARILKRRPNVRLINAMRGEAGLEMARQQRPHMILLDLNLPDMHGSEVLEALRQNETTLATPVVVLSADASARQIDRLLSAGARNYLTKPLNIDRLLAVVDEVLGEQPGM